MSDDCRQYPVSCRQMDRFRGAIASDPTCKLVGDAYGGTLHVCNLFGKFQLYYSHLPESQERLGELTIIVAAKPPRISNGAIFLKIGELMQKAGL